LFAILVSTILFSPSPFDSWRGDEGDRTGRHTESHPFDVVSIWNVTNVG
jgi:hypothetical protein